MKLFCYCNFMKRLSIHSNKAYQFLKPDIFSYIRKQSPLYPIDLWYFILLILLFLQKLLDNVNNNLDKARSDQQVLRNFEARDRNTQENNFQRVNFLSGVQVFIMLSVALTQVLLIRSLFDDRKKVQMRASTWWKVPVRLYGFRKLFHVVWSCLIDTN